MKKGVLITLPKSDDTTEYLTAFSKPIIEICSEHSLNFSKLEGEEATREIFEKRLSNLDFKMIIFNGHGSLNCIAGHRNKEIIKIGENESLLLGRITYARSCWFALGLEKCKENCGDEDGCFIGYKIPFEFLINPYWAANPQKDNAAKVFFDTSNLVPISIIKGLSVQEAHENSRKSMLKAINKVLDSLNEESLAIAKSLWNNYYGQTVIGNKNSKLS